MYAASAHSISITAWPMQKSAARDLNLHRRTRRLLQPLTRPPPKPPPLWRFFLAATVIVLVVGSVFFARHLSADIRVSGKVIGSPTPSAQDRDRAASTPRPQETF